MRLSIKPAGATAIPPWKNVAEPWRDHDGVVFAYLQVDGNEHWIHFPGLASFSFSSRGEPDVAAAVASPESDELVVQAFHRRVLPVVVQVRGREVLHASAIRATAGVVTFCGFTESGKSTLAFGLSRWGGWPWFGDTGGFVSARWGEVG